MGAAHQSTTRTGVGPATGRLDRFPEWLLHPSRLVHRASACDGRISMTNNLTALRAPVDPDDPFGALVRELTDLDYTARDGGAVVAVIDRTEGQDARLSAGEGAGEGGWTLRLSSTTPPAAQVVALYLVVNAGDSDEKALLRDIADAMQVPPQP